MNLQGRVRKWAIPQSGSLNWRKWWDINQGFKKDRTFSSTNRGFAATAHMFDNYLWLYPLSLSLSLYMSVLIYSWSKKSFPFARRSSSPAALARTSSWTARASTPRRSVWATWSEAGATTDPLSSGREGSDGGDAMGLSAEISCDLTWN